MTPAQKEIIYSKIVELMIAIDSTEDGQSAFWKTSIQTLELMRAMLLAPQPRRY
jgi:hypothetical protein